MRRASPRILIVDDEPTNLKVLRQVFHDEPYRLSFARSGEEALALIEQEVPDLVLLDVMMPGMTGYEVCQVLNERYPSSPIPVILVTALQDTVDEVRGFELGAVDYITKPFAPAIIKVRVRNQLSLVRAEELRRTQVELIERLGQAAEYKDNETGKHVIRMSRYSSILARAYGFCDEAAQDLELAAPMHDIGKIGIPDSILLKPGRLTEDEFEQMKQHPLIGTEILGQSDSELIKLARSIALTHHEKWDGTGYPHGLAGEEIPIEGRIVALADVFDALTSKRPYKDAWSVSDAMGLIREQSGRHFDPALVTLLEQEMTAILEVKARWAEDD
ncbi:MAG: two-component system response regulator [Oceanospirillales bacterium]|nr:two-component system response regulator [Oceanospirillales bacterium]